MEIDPIVDAAALDKAVRKPIVQQGLHKIKIDGEELYKWRVICGILKLLFEHYDRLIDAKTRSFPQHTIAYHARCLLELVVWTKFALESDDNIKKIDADSLNDSKDLLNKLKDFSTKSGKPFNLNFNTYDERLMELAKKEGYEAPTKEYLSLRKVASDVGLLLYYESNNKFLSKIVHPTAFSIVGLANDSDEASITLEIVKAGCNWYATSVKALALMFDLEITWQSDSTI